VTAHRACAIEPTNNADRTAAAAAAVPCHGIAWLLLQAWTAMIAAVASARCGSSANIGVLKEQLQKSRLKTVGR